MSLANKIAEYKKGFSEKVPKDIQAIMAKATNDLANSGLPQSAPKTGDKLKAFSLPNQTGQQITLESLTAKGPVIITFYRGGWCPYCNLELKAYQEQLQNIQNAGASLVAITPELPDQSLSTKEKNELGFEVLSDVNAQYAKLLNVVFSLPNELKPIYKQFGIEIEQHNGEGQFELPLAATYIVDSNGTIIYDFVSADYTQRAEPSEVIAALNKR